MATIYLDKQSGNWKVKTSVNGKDTRVRIRKATPTERSTWEQGNRDDFPHDVVRTAGRHGHNVGPDSPKPTPQPKQPAAPPDDLPGFLTWHMGEYAKYKRIGSVQKLGGIVDRFRRYLGTDDPIRVADVDAPMLEGFFHWRLAQRDPRLNIAVKPHCVVGELELFSGVFKAAVERNMIPINPLAPLLKTLRNAYPRPNPDDETKYLDPKQRDAFLTALESGVRDGMIPQDYADLARVMLATGLRVGAACAMEWSWIDGALESIKVPQANDKACRGYTAAIADLGQKVLTRRLQQGKSGRVFPTTSPDVSYYHLQRVCSRYNVPATGSFNHMLRHSFATALVDAEQPIQVIGELLGQRNLKTTQRYAKVRDVAKRNAVGKLRFA